MSPEQLSLLDWYPPCRKLAFPLAARVGKVRRVADVIPTKAGSELTGYWKQLHRHFIDHLSALGYTANEIEVEIDAFEAAVYAELARRKIAGVFNPRSTK